jgi:hypothetical protein
MYIVSVPKDGDADGDMLKLDDGLIDADSE